jgi:hypothetical protein
MCALALVVWALRSDDNVTKLPGSRGLGEEIVVSFQRGFRPTTRRRSDAPLGAASVPLARLHRCPLAAKQPLISAVSLPTN